MEKTTMTLEEREAAVLQTESELQNWAGEIQEREREVLKRERVLDQWDDRVDRFFDDVNRKHQASICLTVEQPAFKPVQPEPVQHDPTIMITTAVAMIMSLVAVVTVLISMLH